MRPLIDIALECGNYTGEGLRLLHVGACTGAEIPGYLERKLEPICIEGDPKSAAIFKKNFPTVELHVTAVSDKCESRLWYPTIPPVCSSLHPVDPAVVAERFPTIRSLPPYPIDCVTVDSLWLPKIDIMVVDTQGHDFEVLAGAEETLKTCEVIICEVWFKPLYKDTKLLDAIKYQLDAWGFTLKHIRPGSTPDYWGDAIFVRDRAYLR